MRGRGAAGGAQVGGGAARQQHGADGAAAAVDGFEAAAVGIDDELRAGPGRLTDALQPQAELVAPERGRRGRRGGQAEQGTGDAGALARGSIPVAAAGHVAREVHVVVERGAGEPRGSGPDPDRLDDMIGRDPRPVRQDELGNAVTARRSPTDRSPTGAEMKRHAVLTMQGRQVRADLQTKPREQRRSRFDHRHLGAVAACARRHLQAD